jgi:hypothetical protein
VADVADTASVHEQVRASYAAAARAAAQGAGASCCGEGVALLDVRGEQVFTDALTEAGFKDIEINETHRVHEHAVSAIVRARTPQDPCCSSTDMSVCCEPASKEDCCGGSTQGATAVPGQCGCGSGERH